MNSRRLMPALCLRERHLTRLIELHGRPKRLRMWFLGGTEVRCGSKPEDGGLLDHLVGCGEQRLRYCQAKHPCGLEIDDKLILGWRLHRHVGPFLALEDSIDVP